MRLTVNDIPMDYEDADKLLDGKNSRFISTNGYLVKAYNAIHLKLFGHTICIYYDDRILLFAPVISRTTFRWLRKITGPHHFRIDKDRLTYYTVDNSSKRVREWNSKTGVVIYYGKPEETIPDIINIPSECRPD